MVATPLLPPRRRPRYRFALTPLADAMFQLLIFFMLSSSQVPYSMLTLAAGDGPGRGAGTDAPRPAGTDAALWSIDAGAVVAGGQRFAFDALPALSTALVDGGTDQVVLVARGTASVQDVVTVTEALTAAGMPRIAFARTGAP